MGAGAKHRLVFVDRLLATLVHLRLGTTHDVLACWFGVDRSTVTRAIAEVRPLLAERGCTISPGVRLRNLAEVVDDLGASGKIGIVDGTEIRVRRPAVGRKDRERFISGKSKQNAVKAMVLTDQAGRVLFCSPAAPGSCADITHARRLGLAQLLTDGPPVEILHVELIESVPASYGPSTIGAAATTSGSGRTTSRRRQARLASLSAV
ncbi:transposase family protein [Streptodolium elevatio]|uniref:Transposase family protein n=1 Tax=Streptodolium elevatio TaxID=3157996 RepID=A0ABV3DTZ2_9ACTN